jgi:NAD(P)-dependent dehydrogenase (short-subunit alcohol dehydrogenase family)
MFSLSGKRAIVTGATGHLGLQIAQTLAEAGAHVLVNGRDAERVHALVEQLSIRKLSAEAAVFDVTDATAVEAYFATRPVEPLHVIINNAYSGSAGNVERSGEESYRTSFEISVVAVQHLFRRSLGRLRAAVAADGLASVINIASMYATVSPDQRIYDSGESANPPFYGAAKAALLQWTRYAACEFGKEGIRINAISPGPFPSGRVARENPAFVARLADRVPMGRVGRAEEISGPVLFLATGAASYVNGTNLVVDGGWTSW